MNRMTQHSRLSTRFGVGKRVVLSALVGMGVVGTTFSVPTTFAANPHAPSIHHERKLPVKLPVILHVLSLADGSPMARVYKPIDQNSTTLQVKDWLAEGEVVSVKLPANSNGVVHANINPATLTVMMASHQMGTIAPTTYVAKDPKTNAVTAQYEPDTVTIVVGTETIYVKSKALFMWLKKNEWKSQFHPA